ncbi:MAG: ubiquinol-cytochrome c reductase iron-sulfur subunit [Bacteroidota bacterium]
MNRNEFLRGLGLSTGAIVATYCMGSLTSCEDRFAGVTPSGTIDFTLDLSNSSYSTLLNKGGWIRTQNVVIAHTPDDNYVAVTQICSHEGQRQVGYRPSNNDFYCSAHGALFDINGNGENANGRRGIQVYNVSLEGTMLRVYS